MIGNDVFKWQSLFKQRKNRQFNYRPRFQNDDSDQNESRFENNWKEARLNSQKRGKRIMSLPVLIIMLIAIIVLMYILNGYM